MTEILDQKDTMWRELKGWQWVRKNHGSLYDRGSADSYYGRGPSPHYGGIGGCPYPEERGLTDEERAEYMAGYMYNERHGDKKDWN
jgi:hypothetical protein